jgi:hypothetical protein
MNWEEYLSNSSYMADNMSRKEFGEKLMLAFKQRNISEGLQWYQAIWLHHRVREWQVTYPEALGGDICYVDVCNMMYSGDIETACLALQYGVVDDMTKPFHCVTEDRKAWLIAQMKAWLGWP